MVSEKELLREAARVFRFLADPETVLRKRSDGGVSSPRGWQVWRRARARSGALDVANEVVMVLLARGWLVEPTPGQARLGQAGHQWWLSHDAVARDDGTPARNIGLARIEDHTGTPLVVRVNHAESPLAWLRRRRRKDGEPIIDEAQYGAGEMLRQDFEAAQLRQSVTGRWDLAAPVRAGRRKVGYRDRDLSDSAIDARDRVYRALEGLGPELAQVAVDTCCYLRGLEETETAHGWPKRSAKIVLQIALSHLARHYGLEKPAPKERP